MKEAIAKMLFFFTSMNIDQKFIILLHNMLLFLLFLL
jgi:hypothetical protein